MTNPIKAELAVLFLLLGLTAGCAARPFDDAMAAYNRKDYVTVLKILRPLAEQGSAEAQYDIGFMYTNGQGVSQDYVEAAKWYRKAAEQGHAAAQNNLGFLYENGLGMPKDYVQAHAWFNLAAAHFSASEAGNRDMALKSRDAVTAKMTPAQIAEAQKLAREWKPSKPAEGKK